MAIPFRPVATHDTVWTPKQAKVTLNARLDARIVPCGGAGGGARLAHSHVVVLDDFFGEAEHSELLELLTGVKSSAADEAAPPPADRWERETTDAAGGARTWGLRDSVLQMLEKCPGYAMRELHARLCRLYPEVDIVHMPSDAIEKQPSEQEPVNVVSDADDSSTAEEIHCCRLACTAQSLAEAQDTACSVSGQRACVGSGTLVDSLAANEMPDSGAACSDHMDAFPRQRFGAGAPLHEGSNVNIAGNTSGKCAHPHNRGCSKPFCPSKARRHTSAAAGSFPVSKPAERLLLDRQPTAEEGLMPPPAACMDSSREGVAGSHAGASVPAVHCAPFVGNAAAHGDAYTWHVDADPAAFPDGRWRAAFGDYVNGDPGRPLFVSLLVYLVGAWPRAWDAETLFLDTQTDVGIVVCSFPRYIVADRGSESKSWTTVQTVA